MKRIYCSKENLQAVIRYESLKQVKYLVNIAVKPYRGKKANIDFVVIVG